MEPSSTLVSGRIVVGVDGSDHARRALVWALEEAAVRHAALDVVNAWPVQPMAPALGFPTPLIHPDERRLLAKETLEEELKRAERMTTARPPIVRPVALEGRAGPVLVHHAEDADLLVVGRCGHGRIVGSMLGSASRYCVHHAHIPVVVVPYPQ
jgi:nucleotide-binding universal stress UspA family protein